MENGVLIKAKRIEKRRRIKVETRGGEEKREKEEEEGEKEERRRGRRNDSWMAICLTKHLNKIISYLDSDNHL